MSEIFKLAAFVVFRLFVSESQLGLAPFLFNDEQ